MRCRAGERVLDVGCGTGHAALAAADVVGPGGHRRRRGPRGAAAGGGASEGASQQGIEHIDFVEGDFRALGSPDGAFDVVLCSFAIFLVPDMPGALGELWRMVAPGGRLGVTSWGPELFEPAGSIWGTA